MDKQQKRPVYLDLPKLASKMSITAKVSILHRASGVLMFVALPFILSLFHKSLTNAEFYSNCYAIGSLPIMKIIYIVLIWAIMHHMCAGIRFVLLDMHKGIDRIPAQRSARWVIVVSLLLTIALGALIW
ncbi:MAG: succinate dehydrogenase, cytochrome b556 subunit [Burkholderiales bacterium]|jgi:succinate dehydrogenase / fumarate reductase cytochrome b subunit|nr:succinate dehydrogenase, cytochrome b556 subunit [Burkholderiales bacterium]